MNLSLHSSNPTLRRRRRGEISPVSPSPTPTRPNPRSEAPSASSTIRQRRPSPAKPRPNIRLRLWPLPEEAREHIKSIWDKADLIKILYQGIKAKDVYDLTSSGKGCSKRCREDFTKEKEDLELEEKFAQKLQSMGIPQQFDIDPTTTDGTSRDEEDNSNNNIEVENDFESDSEED
nr:putative fructokinase-2 [Quercus suber]